MNYAEKYAKWLDSNTVSDNEKEILKKLDEKEAEDSFYRDLEFGTGGLRGVMGLGTNRMNIYIVRQATQRNITAIRFTVRTGDRFLPKQRIKL